MIEEPTLTLTKDEMTSLQLATYLLYQEYKDAENHWPYPPSEVAEACREGVYRLYMKIKNIRDKMTSDVCPILARIGRNHKEEKA